MGAIALSLPPNNPLAIVSNTTIKAIADVGKYPLAQGIARRKGKAVSLGISSSFHLQHLVCALKLKSYCWTKDVGDLRGNISIDL